MPTIDETQWLKEMTECTNESVTVTMTFQELVTLAGNANLGYRHPGNLGPSRIFALSALQKLAEAVAGVAPTVAKRIREDTGEVELRRAAEEVKY